MQTYKWTPTLILLCRHRGSHSRRPLEGRISPRSVKSRSDISESSAAQKSRSHRFDIPENLTEFGQSSIFPHIWHQNTRPTESRERVMSPSANNRSRSRSRNNVVARRLKSPRSGHWRQTRSEILQMRSLCQYLFCHYYDDQRLNTICRKSSCHGDMANALPSTHKSRTSSQCSPEEGDNRVHQITARDQ
jgi:hypothetical protein